MHRIFISFLAFFFLYSLRVSAVDAAETATVKIDSLTVYSQMTEKSAVVKTFRKGETVTVEFEISGHHGAWCGITEKAQPNISGFVLCEYLDRAENKVQSLCFWKINADFWGDAEGNAVVRIPCTGGASSVSISSNRGNYDNIPIKASGDEKSVTISGAGSYGYVSYSGIAKTTEMNASYSGEWKVKLTGKIDGRIRNFSGRWKGIGNYKNKCSSDSCRP